MDTDQWAALYRDLLPRVFHYFCYRVGDTWLAEDLTAITFEKAWRGRWRFRGNREAFSRWLFGIARHVAADHFRHNGRPHLPLEDVTLADPAPSPEEQVQRQADFERLSALLAALSERERELIALKYGAEMTNRAIARLTGLSESNVGTILHRAVIRLRCAWKEAEQ